MATDNVWMTNRGSGTVSKLRASDGAVLATFAVGSGAYSIAFDGANVWVANSDTNTVSKRQPIAGGAGAGS